MDNSTIQSLLDRYLSGACTVEEQRQVEEWLHRVGTQDNAWETMDTTARVAWLAALYGDIQHSVELDDHAAEKPAKVIPLYRRPVFRVGAAAVIILLLGIGTFLWLRQQNTTGPVRSAASHGALTDDALPGRYGAILILSDQRQITLDSLGDGLVTTQGRTTVQIKNGQLVYSGSDAGDAALYNTMTTPRGREYRLTLPDGSGVWLNAASSITYPTVFTGKERTVSITGEAYFEIAKDGSRPFHVKVDQMDVEVLGTHFNINAYRDGGSIRTTLLEGSVKITAAQRSVMLRPGQQASLSSAAQFQVRADADLDEVMAWKNGFFKFNNTDIRTVMQQLERWYDLQVVYEGDVPKDRFGGRLPRDANASEVLKALEQTQVHFRIEGKKLIVMP